MVINSRSTDRGVIASLDELLSRTILRRLLSADHSDDVEANGVQRGCGVYSINWVCEPQPQLADDLL